MSTMKSQTRLLCKNGLALAIDVDSISARKIAKQIDADLQIKTSICLSDYVSKGNSDYPLYISNTKEVVAVIVAPISNIAVPNKNLILPHGKPN